MNHNCLYYSQNHFVDGLYYKDLIQINDIQLFFTSPFLFAICLNSNIQDNMQIGREANNKN